MKILTILALTLGVSTSFAANESIKLCNPENKSQTMEIAVKDKIMSIKTVDADGSVVTEDEDLNMSLVLTSDELTKLSMANHFPSVLVSATAYNLKGADDAYVIATDATGSQYLLEALGEYVEILGTSANCK